MSKYTTQVRFICETVSGLTESVGYGGINAVIEGAIPKIFDFEFPLYDDSYRNVLCSKILRHYYTREIGAETVGLWKFWLNTRLNEIMPYYNQLYKSAMIEFNPMYDVDLTTKHERSNDGVTNSTNNHDHDENATDGNVTRDAFSDTPQGSLDNVENMTYLTNARKISNDRTSTRNYNATNNGETAITSFEDYTQTIVGKNGGASYSKRLREFRETFLNIDMMIIDELRDLFINLW